MNHHSIVPAPGIKQNEEDPDKHKYGFSMVLVIAIAIPVVGVVSGWNVGAASGLWSVFVGTVVVGLLYTCLICCYGELCGTVPFSGGAFGYCRCALGPFWGFVVGAIEVLQYFSYGIVASTTTSYALTAAFQTSPDVQPVYVLLVYVVTFFLQLRGGNLLWNAVIVCSIITIVPVVLFLCGAFAKYDYNKYADMQPTMYNGFPEGEEFMTSGMFGSICFFIGIEMLPQVCNHVRNPNVTLPRGLFYGCLLAVLLSLLAVIACAGIAPGYGEELSYVIYPLDGILHEIYGIPARTSNVLFVVPASLVCAFSMMYSSSHQMSALAKSALLPTFLGSTYGPYNVPYIALLVTTLLQYTMYCAIYFKYTKFVPYFMLVISAIFVYLGVFAAYIVFSLRFKNMQRHWYSPLGITGAVVGIGLDVVLMVSIMGYTFEDTTYITVFFVYVALCALYYFLYAQHHQFFSPEEQQKFLKAYITNVNKRKRASQTTFSVSAMVGDMMVVMFGRSNLFGGGSSHQSTNSRAVNNSAGRVASRSEHASPTKRAETAAPESQDAAAVDSSPTDEVTCRRNQVVPVLTPLPMPVITEIESPEIMATCPAEPTEPSANDPSLDTTGSKKRQRSRRVSWNVNNQGVFGMSNKVMSAKESQKFVEMVLSHGDEPPEEMLAALANTFPEQFVLETHFPA